MEAIENFITGDNFYWVISIIIFCLVFMAARIGYAAGKAHKFKTCQCEDPKLSNLLICEKCEKHIDV